MVSVRSITVVYWGFSQEVPACVVCVYTTFHGLSWKKTVCTQTSNLYELPHVCVHNIPWSCLEKDSCCGCGGADVQPVVMTTRKMQLVNDKIKILVHELYQVLPPKWSNLIIHALVVCYSVAV